MEAEKIIKGLEICASVEENCDKCPYEGCYDCSQTLKEDTLALIKSQQAQIEELTEKVCVLREELEIGTNEHLMTIHDLKKKNEELSNKHWSECRQIAHYANGVPINLPCEAGATVYVIIRKKIKGNKKSVPQIEKGAVDRFIIGEAGVPIADICLDSGVWCAVCGPDGFYLTLKEAEEALNGKTEEQKK